VSGAAEPSPSARNSASSANMVFSASDGGGLFRFPLAVVRTGGRSRRGTICGSGWACGTFAMGYSCCALSDARHTRGEVCLGEERERELHGTGWVDTHGHGIERLGITLVDRAQRASVGASRQPRVPPSPANTGGHGVTR